jgi:hypothetical protein
MASKILFWEGVRLGSTLNNLRTTNLNNVLTTSLKEFFFSTSSYMECITYFSDLARRDIELNCVLAEVVNCSK